MLALAVGFWAVDLDAASGPQTKHSSTAPLHISVYVIPVIHAAPAAGLPARQSTPIAYNLESPQLQRKYEQHTVLRPMFDNPREPALLKTLVIVPE